MTAVRAVVFDIGNILIRWEPERMLRQYFAGDAELNAFLDETKLFWMNLEFDAGRPFADGVAELVGRFPRHKAPLEAFDARWSECVTGAIAGNVETLEALKAAGRTVHAITNFSREKFDVARATYPFLNLFEHALVSGDIGLIKPDYRIYHRFCHTPAGAGGAGLRRRQRGERGCGEGDRLPRLPHAERRRRRMRGLCKLPAGRGGRVLTGAGPCRNCVMPALDTGIHVSRAGAKRRWPGRARP